MNGFEKKSTHKLAEFLRRFYGELHDPRGEKYSHNTMHGIRAGINGNLTNPHHNLKIYVKADEFKHANQVFDGYLKENKREGQDETKHKESINDDD